MQSILSTLNRPLRVVAKLLRDRRGAAAVLLAIALSGIVGFAGLGSEVASWYYTTRSMQGAADSAAATAAATLSSAKATGSTITGDQLRNAARSVAATFNFTDGTGSRSLTKNWKRIREPGLRRLIVIWPGWVARAWMIWRAGVIVFDGRMIAVLLPSRVIVAVTFFDYHLGRRGCGRGGRHWRRRLLTTG